jgi:hypothetical protein
MKVAQHAERILTAWNLADPTRFRRELESAMSCLGKEAPADHLEYEHLEVLESLVEHLSAASARPGGVFVLLEHLSQRAAA